MKKFLSIFILFSINCNLILGDVIDEQSLDFDPNPQHLQQGHIQLALTLMKSGDFFSRYPLYSQLDLWQLQEISGHKILASHYAFVAPRSIDQYTASSIHNPEGFTKFSDNVTVSEVKRISPNLIGFNIEKKIYPFKVKAKMEYGHYQLETLSAEDRRRMWPEIFSDEFFPKYFTDSYTYHFSPILYKDVFKKSFNICFYAPYSREETLISCFLASAISESALAAASIASFGTFNAKFIQKNLREEILYTIGKIQSQQLSEGEVLADDLMHADPIEEKFYWE